MNAVGLVLGVTLPAVAWRWYTACHSCAMVPRWRFFASCICSEPRAARFRPAS